LGVILPRNNNIVSLYRPRSSRIDLGHVPERDRGFIAPVYRGWKSSCTGAEIERLKREIDDCWITRYQTADTPAARVLGFTGGIGLRMSGWLRRR
jgi:hypothetical protein